MNNFNLADYIPLILSTLALFGSAIGWLTGRKKREADTASVLTGTALDLVERLDRQLTALQGTIESQRSRISSLEESDAKKSREIADLNSKLLIATHSLVDAQREIVELQAELLKANELIERLRNRRGKLNE